MITALDGPIKFVVMGDSAAFGTGDVVKGNRPLGWTYRIANAIEAPLIYLNIARPGAKSSELVEHQLPIVKSLKPDIAVIVVGGNDLLRNNFCPKRLKRNLIEVFSNLNNQGTKIITLELHDPSKLLKLPKALESALLKRINAVNDVYRELANVFPLIPIKTREISGVNDKKNWHVDLLHPGPRGHALLAVEGKQLLRQLGIPVNELNSEEVKEFSKLQKFSWMIFKGAPWLFKRCFDLLPVAIYLMLREIFSSRGSRAGS